MSRIGLLFAPITIPPISSAPKRGEVEVDQVKPLFSWNSETGETTYHCERFKRRLDVTERYLQLAHLLADWHLRIVRFIGGPDYR